MVKFNIQKANALLKFLYRKQNFLNLHSKKLLVMSLIKCHFDYYACSFWYPGLSKFLRERLQATKNMVRFVLKQDPSKVYKTKAACLVYFYC